MLRTTPGWECAPCAGKRHHFRRQARGLPAKNQRVFRREGEAMRSHALPRAGQHQTPARARPRQIRFQIRPDRQPDVRPVIKPGPLQVAILQAEAKRFDQMQGQTERRAQASHIARVGRNFRLVEHNIHRNVSKRLLSISAVSRPHPALSDAQAPSAGTEACGPLPAANTER